SIRWFARKSGPSLILRGWMDIPLLFETGGEHRVDVVVVVTADADIQRQRVLSRDGMSEERFRAILAKQVPDAVKREKADFLIDTGLGIEAAQRRVDEILSEVRNTHTNR
ncbi:MAG: dephospho-CoA kinase, partial [Pseudomonadota bacterium]